MRIAAALNERAQYTLYIQTNINAMNTHTSPWRSFKNRIIADINCYMAVIANKIATPSLRKRQAEESRVVPHVICIMIVPRSVVMCVSSRGFEQKEHRKLSSLSIGGAHAF